MPQSGPSDEDGALGRECLEVTPREQVSLRLLPRSRQNSYNDACPIAVEP